MFKNSFLTLTFAVVVFGFLEFSFAEQQKAITVIGTGRAKTKPTSVEISAKLSASASLVDDALKKYQANRRRLVEAVSKLNLKNLSIKTGGISVKNSVQGLAEPQGNAPNNLINGIVGAFTGNSNSKIVVTEPFEFRLTGIGEMEQAELFAAVSKVIEVAKDTGVQMNSVSPQTIQMVMGDAGQPLEFSLTTYKIDDRKAVVSEAFTAAMQDARERANRLAILSERKLGKVLNVQETSVAKVADQSQDMETMFQQMYGYGYVESVTQTGNFDSKNFGDIEIEATLTVTYEISD